MISYRNKNAISEIFMLPIKIGDCKNIVLRAMNAELSIVNNEILDL
jgi:hypothetical protein